MKSLQKLEQDEFMYEMYIEWLFKNYTIQEIMEFEDDELIFVAFSNYIDDSLPF
jgi:CRISPR/Cas system-associated exonuclease Cas4 (RecB family)